MQALNLARSRCSVAGGAVLLDNRGRDPTACGDLVVVGDRLRTNRRSVGLGADLVVMVRQRAADAPFPLAGGCDPVAGSVGTGSDKHSPQKGTSEKQRGD